MSPLARRTSARPASSAGGEPGVATALAFSSIALNGHSPDGPPTRSASSSLLERRAAFGQCIIDRFCRFCHASRWSWHGCPSARPPGPARAAGRGGGLHRGAAGKRGAAPHSPGAPGHNHQLRRRIGRVLPVAIRDPRAGQGRFLAGSGGGFQPRSRARTHSISDRSFGVATRSCPQPLAAVCAMAAAATGLIRWSSRLQTTFDFSCAGQGSSPTWLNLMYIDGRHF
jgi:hypothetical protein